jgi:hypothetical protein
MKLFQKLNSWKLSQLVDTNTVEMNQILFTNKMNDIATNLEIVKYQHHSYLFQLKFGPSIYLFVSKTGSKFKQKCPLVTNTLAYHSKR